MEASFVVGAKSSRRRRVLELGQSFVVGAKICSCGRVVHIYIYILYTHVDIYIICMYIYIYTHSHGGQAEEPDDIYPRLNVI